MDDSVLKEVASNTPMSVNTRPRRVYPWRRAIPQFVWKNGARSFIGWSLPHNLDTRDRRGREKSQFIVQNGEFAYKLPLPPTMFFRRSLESATSLSDQGGNGKQHGFPGIWLHKRPATLFIPYLENWIKDTRRCPRCILHHWFQRLTK